MTAPGGGARKEQAVRREAHVWSARMHGDDAEVHRAAFERWRAADPLHAEIYAQLEQQWSAAGLLAGTRAARSRKPLARHARFQPQMRYAMAAALVLGLTAVLVLVQPRWFGGNNAAEAAELASRIGEIRTVKLTDGSTMTLDTDSAARLAFTSAERRLILLRGRARFDVAHDPGRPFIVLAGSGAVIARGTLFDVSLREGEVRVALLRGRVDVRQDSAAGPRSRTIARLTPGQVTAFAARTPLAPPRPAPRDELDWPSGMLSFEADRLSEAIAEANRYSTARIRLVDPAMGELRVTGAYRAGDTAGLARSLATSFGLEMTSDAGGDIMLARPAVRPQEKN